MAIGELLGALEREAATDVAALDAAARADASRITADAAARRERRRVDDLTRTRATAGLAHDAALAQVARQGRGAVLTARAAALVRLYDAVAARLPALLAGAGGERLLDRLVAAVVAVAGEDAHLRCPPALAAAVSARIGGLPGLTVEADAAVTTGVIALRDGGRVRIDATLATMLERLWPRLRVEVRPTEAAP